MNFAISPATAAPVRHDLSNHSGVESPMKLNEKEWESQALQGELNTSNNASLGLGLDVRQLDFPTDESGGSSEATNRVESVWSKEQGTTAKDQINDASGSETIHRNEVASGLSEDSTRGIRGPSAEKNPREPATTSAFELPKEVSTETKGHYVGPMSPLTPDTYTPRPSDEFNCTIDLGPAVSEAIAGLSPIIARESDYHMIQRIPLESHVVRNDSKDTAHDAPLGPASALKKTNANGPQSQQTYSHSDQDHALTNYQSTQTSEDEDVDTTEVFPEATEPYGRNDSQDIPIQGTCLSMINISDEGEPKSRHELERVATHFEDEQETDTSNVESSIEADAFSSQNNTSKGDQALTEDQSRQAVEKGDAHTAEVSPEMTEPYEMNDTQDTRAETSLGTINVSIKTETTRMSSTNSIGEIDSHSELEHAAAHFEKEHEIGTAGPDVFSVGASNILKEDAAKKLSASTSIGDTASHPELQQIAAHFGEEHETGTIDPEAGYEAHVYSSPAGNTSEEGEAKRLGSVSHPELELAALHFGEGNETGAYDPEDSHEADVVTWQARKRLGSLSSIGGMERHAEREQAAAFFRGKQETVPSNPESSLEADGVEVYVERTAELDSSLTSRQHIDSPNPSTSSNRESFDSGENGCTQLKSSQAYKDLTSAKKHLDASSLAFIERLRGAAHRRKLQVARSRDDLVAKEREQLLSIASSKEQQLSVAPELPPTLQPAYDRVEKSVGAYKPFKARPVPNTTGHFGSGGQVGVPKVEKKPATTPFSPLLGARRPKKEGKSFTYQTLREPRNIMQSKSLPFKARPAPPTTGYLGHGGQAGVPKIPKRPTTVPESPLLGKKRSSFATARKDGMGVSSHVNQDKTASNFPSKREVTKAGPFVRLFPGSEVSRIAIVCLLLGSKIREVIKRLIRLLYKQASKRKETPHRERQQLETVEERNSRAFRARPLPVSATNSATSPSPLLGLQILNTQKTPTRMNLNDTENMEPQVATPQKPHVGIVPYEPHSTVRAKKRASFDERRASNEIVRQEEQQRVRQSVIEQMKKELKNLRDSLR